MAKITSGLKKANDIMHQLQGKILYQMKVLGVQIFMVSKPQPSQYNVFLLFIPVLRIVWERSRFSINILLFSWVHNLLREIKVEKTKESFRISLLGKSILKTTQSRPYDFPATKFKG